MPNSDEFNVLLRDSFVNYALRVSGLVEVPREFSYAQLKAMPKHEQITEHFCIQGWSGVAKWGGGYYDVHKIQNMEHELTLLAYERNGAPLGVLHGAPLRLRCENELGFKMVKWIQAIEFVAEFSHLGAGNGGYNEDHEFYGYRMPI